MSPVRKTVVRRNQCRERAGAILRTLSQGSGDVYLCYRELYSLWTSNNAAVLELKPLFRIPGIEPDGALSVPDSFKAEVRSIAAQIMSEMSVSDRDAK
jgi:hypothetical protein